MESFHFFLKAEITYLTSISSLVFYLAKYVLNILKLIYIFIYYKNFKLIN